MISLFFYFLLSVYAETTKSESVEQSGVDLTVTASSDLQAIVERFQSYSQCANKVWPKSLVGERVMTFVDADGSVWTWSKAKGLAKITNPTEVKRITDIIGNRSYAADKDAKPPGVILAVGAKKPGGVTAPNPSNPSPKPPASGEGTSGNPECDKAIAQKKSVMAGLYQPPDLNSVDSIFKLGVHEGFHICDQSTKESWPHDLISHSENMSRINSYPTNAEPRQMRYKLKTALREALKQNSPDVRQKYLEEAAYWHKEYKAKYGAKEPYKGTDLYEGTARYVDLVANKIDCSKSLDSSTLASVSKEAVLQGISEDPEPTVDSESYALGALSGALLDQQRVLDWKTKSASKGVSPLDQLLDSLNPKKGAIANESQLNAIAGSIPKLADECYVKPDLEYLSQYKDGKHVWVSVPTTRYGGKGTYDGTSVLPQSKYVNIGSSTSTKNIKTSNLPHVVASGNPCGGEQSMMVLVDISSVQNGTVDFQKPGKPPSSVQGIVETKPKASPMGNVYCSPP